MEKQFIGIKPEQITDNPFKIIGSDWMLITAGNMQSYNTMTASWGGLGVLFGKNVSFCFVRPSRYTYTFMEKAEYYTLSFFDGKYKKALDFCGANSGRDCDKAARTGLTPISGDNDTVCFDQARLVLVCRKLWFEDIDPSHFMDPDINRRNYSSGNYHRMYVGEIIRALREQS